MVGPSGWSGWLSSNVQGPSGLVQSKCCVRVIRVYRPEAHLGPGAVVPRLEVGEDGVARALRLLPTLKQWQQQRVSAAGRHLSGQRHCSDHSMELQINVKGEAKSNWREGGVPEDIVN